MKPTEPCPACLSDTATPVGSKNGYAMHRCTNCKTVRVSPQPSAQQLNEYYTSYVGTCDYTKKRDSKLRRSRGRIKRMMGWHSGMDLLDVGCNYGFAVAAASELGLNAKGIDIDETAVNAARAEFGKLGGFETCTVQEYAASGAKADMVYTSEVIEHTLDPNSFAGAIEKILKPGGLLYLTAPDGGHWRVPSDFTKWEQVMPPEHLTYFTRRGLKKMLERHGFAEVKFRLNYKPGIRMTARKYG